MKIVIQINSNAPFYVRSAWSKVFKACGHDVFLWQKENLTSFDMFHHVGQVDILICNTYDADEALLRCIKSRPDMKVAMFASAWGELTAKLDKTKYPIVYVNDNEKKLLERMKKETGRPNICFIHITDEYLEPTMGGWNSIGIKPVGILNGADTFSYLGGVYKEEFACDVSFVGSRWKYKSETLDEYFGPLCEFPSKYKIKIFGHGGWVVPQYLGEIDENEVKNLYVSSVVCPNISEKHSYIFPDLVERIFKPSIAGGLMVCDKVDLSEIFPKDIVPQFNNYQELIEIIDYFKKNEDKRQDLIKKQKDKILSSETYFHRMSKLLRELNLNQEAEKCNKIWQEKLEKIEQISNI